MTNILNMGTASISVRFLRVSEDPTPSRRRKRLNMLPNGLGFCCGAGCGQTPGNSREMPLNPAPSAANACYDDAESGLLRFEPDIVHPFEVRVLGPEHSVIETSRRKNHAVGKG